MIKLYDNGVYLLNGAEIVEDTGKCTGFPFRRRKLRAIPWPMAF